MAGGKATEEELRTLRRLLLRVAEALLHSALASQAANGGPTAATMQPLLAQDDMQVS